MWGLRRQIVDLETENKRLTEALKFLWNLRDRNEPALVAINYTARGKVRDILGRKLKDKLGF
jgi:hypothetical protein